MDKNELPPPGDARWAQALARTGERLVRELAAPEAEAPDWSPREWRAAMAVAVMQGLSGLLAGQLRWQGPALWQGFLHEQLAHSRARERRVRRRLDQIDTAARAAGLPLLALKGSALLRLELYGRGERPMSDIDLLVRPGQAERADALIRSLGYEPGLTLDRHADYLPAGAGARRAFGEHIDNPIKLELHTRIGERLPQRRVDLSAELWPQPDVPGVQAYADRVRLMRHLLLHAAGNLRGHGLRLIQLVDLARLGARLGPDEWAEVFHGDAAAVAWWAAPALSLVQRLLPGVLDADRLGTDYEAARRACPPALRLWMQAPRFDSVSASRWRTPWLPGLAWSGSLAEAGRLLRERLAPPAGQRAQDVRLAAAQPWLIDTPWSRQPRWQRAARYLTGAPPRLQALHAVQLACAYQPRHRHTPA